MTSDNTHVDVIYTHRYVYCIRARRRSLRASYNLKHFYFSLPFDNWRSTSVNCSLRGKVGTTYHKRFVMKNYSPSSLRGPCIPYRLLTAVFRVLVELIWRVVDGWCDWKISLSSFLQVSVRPTYVFMMYDGYLDSFISL